MPRIAKFWIVLAFVLGCLAYVCVAIGGYSHPIELNVASYGSWALLSAMFAYSTYKQKMPIFWMILSWTIGNTALVVFALLLDGYSFNLGASEAICFFGVIGTLSVWATVGELTKKWNYHILLIGGICADIGSFYPQFKQYLLPHERPTTWMIAGWFLWFACTSVQVIFVDRFVQGMRMKGAKRLATLENSAIAIENGSLIVVTTILMLRK